MESGEERLAERTAEILREIGERRPLVHNITNYVVMNYTANALLAIGASPVMAHAAEEVEEMVRIAAALVVNIGTLSGTWIESMFLACRAARRKSIPIVLDPVGAGATRFRTETAEQLVIEARPTVIRGNASEILALSGATSATRGVDSVHAVDDARLAASDLAKRYETVVSVTGAEDYVTDGVRSVGIANGHPMMGRITGSGCSVSAITGAFLSVESDAFVAAAGALIAFGIAGEFAAVAGPGPGTYQALLLDALYGMEGSFILERARLTAA